MTRHLRISDSLQLPVDAVTETFAIIAVRGAGKTNTARVMAEEFFAAGAPFVAIDPVGSWWGLRAGRDGAKGLPIPVLGGAHGDIPLERGGGTLVADLVVDQRLSCVLDLSAFESEAAKKQFLLDFARRVYLRNTQPLHLFLEECDDYCPQKPMRDELQLLRAWENIVRRGRARGLGITLITQRSAVVNKNVLTQVGTLIAMRTTSPQDRAAVEAWVKYHGQKEDLLASLASLESGEAWVWSPQFLGLTKRIKFRLSRTHDSGSTPKLGGGRAPATLADVDLGDLQKQMAATIERAKAEDPKALRAEIAQLRRELAAKPVAKPERVEVPVVTADQLRRLEAVMEGMLAAEKLAVAEVAQLRCSLAKVGVVAQSERDAIIASFASRETLQRKGAPPRSAAASPESSRSPRVRHMREPASADIELPKGEATILSAIAQHGVGVSREQLSVLTGYKRSSRDTYLQKLQQKGAIETQGNTIVATERGIAALGDRFEPLPTGEALREHWIERLPGGERAVLQVVIGAWPQAVACEAIDTATGYRRSSRGTYLQKLIARKLVKRIGRGEVRAAAELFDQQEEA